MKGRDVTFKCIYCGKYISYDDIENNLTESEFTPDTEFSIEETIMWHIKCKEKEDI